MNILLMCRAEFSPKDDARAGVDLGADLKAPPRTFSYQTLYFLHFCDFYGGGSKVILVAVTTTVLDAGAMQSFKLAEMDFVGETN